MGTTRPTTDTREAEAEQAHAAHEAGRGPTPDEEAAADQHDEVDPEVAEAYEDALERGANQQGEGRPGL